MRKDKRKKERKKEAAGDGLESLVLYAFFFFSLLQSLDGIGGKDDPFWCWLVEECKLASRTGLGKALLCRGACV